MSDNENENPEEEEVVEEAEEEEVAVEGSNPPEPQDAAVYDKIYGPSFSERAGTALGSAMGGAARGAKGLFSTIGDKLYSSPEDSPNREANGDDLSDLFRVPKADDPDMRIDDIVTVDREKDVLDGDLSDLVDVSDEDIMGDEEEGEDIGEEDDLSDLFELGDLDDVTPGEPVAQNPSQHHQITPRGRRYVSGLSEEGGLQGVM